MAAFLPFTTSLRSPVFTEAIQQTAQLGKFAIGEF